MLEVEGRAVQLKVVWDLGPERVGTVQFEFGPELAPFCALKLHTENLWPSRPQPLHDAEVEEPEG